MTIAEDTLKPDVGEYIELFMLDCSNLYGASSSDIYYFTRNVYTTTPVKWKGKGRATVTYYPIDIDCEGFESNTKGTLPRPKIRLANASMTMIIPIQRYDDLVGATLTRYRTLKKYLINEAGRTYIDEHLPEDTFIIIQKTAQNKSYIEWELAPSIDVEGIKIPKGLFLQGVCSWRYRKYSVDGWEYDRTERACPVATRQIIQADSDFTSGWSYSSGAWVQSGSSITHTTGNTDVLSAQTFTKAGIRYILFLTVSGMTAGSINASFGGDTPITISGNGSYEVALNKTNYDNQDIKITPTSNFNGTLSNIYLDVYFTKLDVNISDPTKKMYDVCSKRLSGCKLRWYNQDLPFGGFPGISKIRL